jgi:Cyclin, N-terminal domain
MIKPRTLEQAIIYEVLNNSDARAHVLKEQNEYVTDEVLKFHKICDENRTRLVDWILQVLKAFKLSTHATFFLAVSLIDRYLIEKRRQDISLGT